MMAAIAPETSTPTSTATISITAENSNNNRVADTATVVLLNTFLIRGKRFRVFYNAGTLVWERHPSKKGKVTVSATNILAINPRPTNATNDHSTATTENAKHFVIVYAIRSESSGNANKWKYNSVTMCNNDVQVIQQWTQTLQSIIDEQTSRPKKLLLFINPFGGKRRALQIYDHTVKPIFRLAGIDASVVISQRSNQIHDFIMTQSLEHFDGIVCIGGDGTFSEVFNGLIFRTIQDLNLERTNIVENLPNIQMPIGVIPAGSTDTVAYCLNGTTDIRTTALNIALGLVDGLDLSSVSNDNGIIKFYASVMSYGFLGDVAVESEKFRWMGSKRYDYSGLKKLLLNRGYEGEVSMLMAPEKNVPSKGPQCLENCQVCCTNRTNVSNKETGISSVIQNTVKRSGDEDDNSIENKTVFRDSSFIASNLTSGSNINLSDETYTCKKVSGKFFMINGANISCACSRAPNGFSKYSHLCDGHIDLILVRHTTFLNNIKFLLAMSSRNYLISNLSHVEIYRTKMFSFRLNALQSGISSYNLHSSRMPISGSDGDNRHTSAWNCDGEVIHDSEVTVRSHRRLINVYRRGLFNAQVNGEESDRSEPSCCGL